MDLENSQDFDHSFLPSKNLRPALLEEHAARWRELAYCSSLKARALLPRSQAEKLNVLPLSVQNTAGQEVLIAAFASPLKAEVIQEVRFIVGCEVISEEIASSLLPPAIRAAYGGKTEEVSRALELATQELLQGSAVEKVLQTAPTGSVDQSSVSQLLSSLLERALFLGASDIHFEPQSSGSRIRFRVHGVLKEDRALSLSAELAQRLAQRIKVLCNLPPNGPPQASEGGFSFNRASYPLRLRVSILPMLKGEKVVLRLLHQSLSKELTCADHPFSALGMSREQERLLSAYLTLERGTILLSGPTGSGKTTLLYAVLEQLNNDWRNIITLEDPVERIISGLNQCELNEQSSFSYEDVLPRLLRQDPDVVMIGEIRKAVTAELALNGAITGSLVLSTVHAGTCIEVFIRLLQLGVNAQLLAAALRLVVSQRLLERNCPECLSRVSAPKVLSGIFALPPASSVAWSKGCSACNGRGVSARFGVFEFLVPGANIKELLASAERISPLHLVQQAYRDGYQPLISTVRKALLVGDISPAVALRAVGYTDALGSTLPT